MSVQKLPDTMISLGRTKAGNEGTRENRADGTGIGRVSSRKDSDDAATRSGSDEVLEPVGLV